jgi:methionyl-tRNA formyltransferase
MKFGIIGNDQMVQSCIRILMETPGAEISFVLYDVARLNPLNPVDKFCEKNNISSRGITRLNTPENYEFIKNHQPDYFLSISNFFIIREDILSVPAKGTINFHNSSPSKYHGINIPSWVIINGEKTHGAMWHFVERTIDTGEVIAFEEFPVSRKETASSLTVKCIKSGIDMFPKVISQLLADTVSRIPQSGAASYFGKKDFPAGNGYIDFNNNGQEIDQLVRGLNYLPYENPYLHAKLKYNGKEIIVNSVQMESEEKETNPGQITFIDENNFRIACRDCVINITDAMDESENEYQGLSLASYLGVRQHDNLLLTGLQA